MKSILYTLIFFTFSMKLYSQNLLWEKTIEVIDTNLREQNAIVLGILEVDIPSEGKVLVKFEGNSWSSKSDIITLAASNYEQWISNDGNVGVYVYDTLHHVNNFHHSRIYDVSPGLNKFYALGHNWVDRYGSGRATIKGNLIVEFFPSENNSISFIGKGLIMYPLNLTETAKAIDTISIDAATDGKLFVTIDGSSASSPDNELALATSFDAQWKSDSENISMYHNYSDDTKILTYKKVYDLKAGNHNLYVLAKKILGNMESSNNAFYLTFNLQFVPDEQEDYIVIQNEVVHQLIKTDTIKTCGRIDIDVNKKGKALLNFSGYSTSDYDDVVLFALANATNADSILTERKVQPIHINDGKTYLSLTAVVDLKEGINSFNINGNFDSNSNGSGAASLFGKMTVKFIPESVPTSTDQNLLKDEQIILFPNPTTGQLYFNTENKNLESNVTIYNGSGMLINFMKNISLTNESINLENKPDGIYFIKLNHENTMHKVIKTSNY